MALLPPLGRRLSAAEAEDFRATTRCSEPARNALAVRWKARLVALKCEKYYRFPVWIRGRCCRPRRAAFLVPTTSRVPPPGNGVRGARPRLEKKVRRPRLAD